MCHLLADRMRGLNTPASLACQRRLHQMYRQTTPPITGTSTCRGRGLSPFGQFFFDGHYTAGTGSAGQPFADFLLGLPGRVRFGNLITNDYRRRSHAAFVQDHFSVSPRLTVNFGVRWEYLTPVWEDGG